jgi:hypothetical protein
MKIRAGFVSNSSSTSFLIIAKEDFTPEALRSLMGVDESSPLAGMFEELYASFMDAVRTELDMSKIAKDADIKLYFSEQRRDLSAHMLARLNAERGKNVKAYLGRLDSETSPVQTFFCTDSFEEENDQVYINGLECAW